MPDRPLLTTTELNLALVSPAHNRFGTLRLTRAQGVPDAGSTQQPGHSTSRVVSRGRRHWELHKGGPRIVSYACLLYTSDAADDLLCVDLGGRRIIKKKKKK